MCDLLPPHSEEFIQLIAKADRQLAESLAEKLDSEILNSVKESPTLDGN